MKKIIKIFNSGIFLLALVFLIQNSIKVIKSHFKEDSPLQVLHYDVPEGIKNDINHFLYVANTNNLDINITNWTFHLIEDEKSKIFDKEFYNLPILGYCDDKNNRLYFHKELLEKGKYSQRAVVFHEMLHCMYGVNHSFTLNEDGKPDTLMYPREVLTEQDIQENWESLVYNSFSLIKEEPQRITVTNFITDTTTSFDSKSLKWANIRNWASHIDIKSIIGFLFICYCLIFTVIHHIDNYFDKN